MIVFGEKACSTNLFNTDVAKILFEFYSVCVLLSGWQLN